jgi:diaminopimelate epimerase
MRFVKMHGTGNDFVVVDGAAEKVPADPSALARRVCDRHAGIGADGLILMVPAQKGVDADLRMRMYNADGGESEMCGNGIRCVCKLAHDRGLCRTNPMRIQTGRGVLQLGYEVDRELAVKLVTVSMGQPILDAARIPVMLGGLSRVVDADLGPVSWWEKVADAGDWREASGLERGLTCVSMGNPHAVFFCRDVDAVPLAFVGPFLEHHPIFPNRTNVHFVQRFSENEVKVRTWERGSGMTLACGTGASAVCVAGALTGRTGRRLRAHLPGGDLDLEWSEKDDQVRMTGPAVLVYEGEWPD